MLINIRKGIDMKKILNEEQLKSKIRNLEKLFIKNEGLKMYEACRRNLQLIWDYEHDLKKLKERN
tara:strand:+ start:99 stop:293 length:195 start_codon:yes stop_codon:yes gene_type:complete